MFHIIRVCLTHNILAFITVLVSMSSTHAALTVRHFEFGESDVNASGQVAQVGDVVVSVHNRLGELWLPDDPTRMDLVPNAGTSPLYVEGRGGPGSLAIVFDGEPGLAGDFTGLTGNNFCSWCDPDARTALRTVTNGQFDATFNRGFQGWVKPDPAGLGTRQLAIADGGGLWGGVGITPQGNWLHISDRFGIREEVDTGIDVEFGQWTHVAQIITGDVARLFVDGILVDARSIGLGPLPTGAPLTVATRADGQSDPFMGTVDDLKLMLTTIVAGGFDPRIDLDIFEDITFSGVAGDINQDGIVNSDDFEVWQQNVGLSFNSSLIANGRPGRVSNFSNPGSLLLGDANENGIIDLTDFSVIKHAAAAQGNLIIPEPGVMALAVLGLGMVALRRRAVGR